MFEFFHKKIFLEQKREMSLSDDIVHTLKEIKQAFLYVRFKLGENLKQNKKA